MTNDVIYAAAICTCFACMICIAVTLRKRLGDFREFTFDMLSKLSESETQTKQRVEAIEKKLEEDEESLDKEAERARNKIYNEWLENIVSYNPLSKKEG